MNDQSTNHEYAVLFAAIDAAAENFENLHGDLNQGSNFNLYGEKLAQAIIEYNEQNGTNHQPEIILEMWAEDGQKRYELFIENDEFKFMHEALHNLDNLKVS